MTIVAYKDGVLAADTLHLTTVSGGTNEWTHHSKIHISPCKRMAIGITGSRINEEELSKAFSLVESCILDLHGYKTCTEKVTPAHGYGWMHNGRNLDTVELLELIFKKERFPLIMYSDGALAITKPGVGFGVSNPTLTTVEDGIGISIGSGVTYTRWAFKAGLDAVGAVVTAIENDGLCGGDIHIVNRKDLKPMFENYTSLEEKKS